MSNVQRYSKFVTGKCGHCGRESEDTQMHHIISRSKIKKMNRDRLEYCASGTGLSKEEIKLKTYIQLKEILIHKWPNNITEMCKYCHDLTESSELYNKPRRKQWSKKKDWQAYGKQDMSLPQCRGISYRGTKKEGQCKIRGDLNADGLCSTHRYQL